MRTLKKTLFIKIIFPLFIAGVVTVIATPPTKAFSAGAAAGQLNLMIFGNYDFTALDTSNLPVHSPVSNQSFARSFENGYGAGVGFGYWMTDNIAFRMMAQGNLFQGSQTGFFSGSSIMSAPVTAGLKIRLLGDPKHFFFAVVDSGGAYQELVSGASAFGGKEISHGWSSYGDIGIGQNYAYFFLEAKVAYLPQFVPQFSRGQNGSFYVPISTGINF
ncbi:MAG: hypothetical protein ACYCT9_11380 [Leptospirillum sp.]